MPLVCPSRSRAALLALLLLTALSASASAQVGREFWFAWPYTADVTTNDPIYDLDGQLILLAADGPTVVNVQGPGVDDTYAISPGSPATIQLDRDLAMVTQTDVPVDRAFHLYSTGCAPFAALFRVPGTGASVGDDVTRLIPVERLGARYLPVSYSGDSEFLVVAAHDDTEVTITNPHCTPPPTQTLDRGQALLHQCFRELDNLDVTGSIVQASKPVAVISASARSRVVFHQFGPTLQFFFSFEDILLESNWPIDLLGTIHAHPPFRRENPNSVGDLVRLVSACPDVDVNVWEEDGDGWDVTLIDEGSYQDLEEWDFGSQTGRLVSDAALLRSNAPIQVAVYTVGISGAGAAGIGDPSMSLLDPPELWDTDHLVYLIDGDDNSVAVVAPAGSTGSVLMDGSSLGGTWGDVGDGADYAWARVDNVADGEHRIHSDVPVFVLASGYGAVNGLEAGAFSYPAVSHAGDGTVRATIRGGTICETICPGECLTLDAPPGYSGYDWSVPGSGPSIEVCPEETTAVSVTLTDESGCEAVGSVLLEVTTIQNPLTIVGPTEVCEGECVELAASAGFSGYDWEHGDRGRRVTVCPTEPTTYRVTVTDTDSGCPLTAEHTVTPYPPPIPGTAAVHTIDPCVRGLEISWTDATWRPGSPGGVYNVYRREGGCAPPGDPSWVLLASGLAGPPHLDDTVVVGVEYSYLVEAEDEPADAPCDPGPFAGGPTGAVCATPERATDPGDPLEPLLVTLNPYLRSTGYSRRFVGDPNMTVGFTWEVAPGIDPSTFFEVWRSDIPWDLQPYEEQLTDLSWTDSAASGAYLWFYKAYNASECGALGE